MISAFTATATDVVKNDIIDVLGLRTPEVVMTGFDRPNLYFRVEAIKKKTEYISEYIEKHPSESGIIYCATRKSTDALYEYLCKKGVPAARYHAGMENAERKRSQDDFIFDRLPVIVATNAFGMGIDKSNVRYVIHYNMPQSMENYYQEAGRAGRDGEAAECILLFSAQDIMINKLLLEHKEFTDVPEEDIVLIKQRDAKRLQIMEGYCRQTGCLRNYILGYFGERTDHPCGNCGNCNHEYKTVDMTAEAKQVINCVWETRGRYGLNIVVGTLLGAKRARMAEVGTVNYRTYGALKDCSETEIRTLIGQMILDGYLIQTEDKYSVLRLGNIEDLKDGGARVIVRSCENKTPEKAQSKTRKKSTGHTLTETGQELFEMLRELRLEIAREEAVPPYIVFSDKTLTDMCAKLPSDREEMMGASGVGEVKFEKYGEQFLEAIAEFRRSDPDLVTCVDDK